MRDEQGYLAAYDDVAEMGVLAVLQNRERPTFNRILREAIKAGYVTEDRPSHKDPTESYASLTQTGTELALAKGWLERCGYGLDPCQVLVYTDDERCLLCRRTKAQHDAVMRWELLDRGLFDAEDRAYDGNEDGETHHHIHGIDGLSCYGDFTEEPSARYANEADVEIVDLPYCLYPCHQTVTCQRDYNIALLSTYP